MDDMGPEARVILQVTSDEGDGPFAAQNDLVDVPRSPQQLRARLEEIR